MSRICLPLHTMWTIIDGGKYILYIYTNLTTLIVLDYLHACAKLDYDSTRFQDIFKENKQELFIFLYGLFLTSNFDKICINPCIWKDSECWCIFVNVLYSDFIIIIFLLLLHFTYNFKTWNFLGEMFNYVIKNILLATILFWYILSRK